MPVKLDNHLMQWTAIPAVLSFHMKQIGGLS